MTDVSHVLVVGASLAGLRTALALREAGFGGRITMIGAERHPPYDRPPLSKQVLVGDRPAAHPLHGAAELEASWALGDAATALDVRTGTVTTASGVRHRGDAVVIATGAVPRAWTGPGSALPGVTNLRTAEDADRVRGALDRGARVLVVGGGFVGAEVAAAARTRGRPVVLAIREPAALIRSLGAGAAGVVTEGLRRSGVDVRVSTRLSALSAGPDGSVAAARLDDGTEVEADLVVLGIGADPATRWLRGSGLLLGDGVVCDEYCRALLADGALPTLPIVAVGDVARWADPLRIGELTAVRHWSNAAEQARAAAGTLLAEPAELIPYRHIPSFWSDLTAPGLKIRIRAVGDGRGADRWAVVDGSLDAGAALVRYERRGRVVGAVSLNRPRLLPALRAQILAGACADQPSAPAPML